MQRRMRLGAFVACLSMLTVAAPAGAATRGSHRKAQAAPHYYLALGDSLSVGYQPSSAPAGGMETNQGYANDLETAYSKQIKGLKLEDVGCPGETSTSLITGKGNLGAAVFHCPRPQLKKALAFLKAHHSKGEVPLITIDIGANDIDGCASQVSSIVTCLDEGIARIRANLPKILNPLKKAAPKGTKFVAMNLYDPFLAAYLDPYSPLNPLAEASTQFLTDVNNALSVSAKQAGWKTADVADAFMSYNQTPVPFEGKQIPTNVAEICALTWECTAYQNIHANATGYSRIARAFEAVIGKL